jgi:sRNA-binding carbon storage regulator CsrA
MLTEIKLGDIVNIHNLVEIHLVESKGKNRVVIAIVAPREMKITKHIADAFVEE